jgi:hypothetical protein
LLRRLFYRFRGLYEQFFSVNEYKYILRAFSAEAFAYRGKTNSFASASCELRNHLAMSAQLVADV